VFKQVEKAALKKCSTTLQRWKMQDEKMHSKILMWKMQNQITETETETLGT